jgi:hypothetical protein
MIYYGISPTQILAVIAIALVILYLVLLIVAEILERKGAAIQTVVDSLQRCSSGDKDKCEKCEYRHRGTPNQTCVEMLLQDSESLINDQQELIAKFGKKMINDKD